MLPDNCCSSSTDTTHQQYPENIIDPALLEQSGRTVILALLNLKIIKIRIGATAIVAYW
jgi:hypothetical protein